MGMASKVQQVKQRAPNEQSPDPTVSRKGEPCPPLKRALSTSDTDDIDVALRQAKRSRMEEEESQDVATDPPTPIASASSACRVCRGAPRSRSVKYCSACYTGLYNDLTKLKRYVNAMMSQGLIVYKGWSITPQPQQCRSFTFCCLIDGY